MPPTNSTESRTTSTICFIFVFDIYNLLLFRRKKRPKAIKTLSIPRFVFSGISHLWRYALHFVSPIVQRSIVPLRQHSHYFPVDIPFLAGRSQIDIKTFRLSLVCLFFGSRLSMWIRVSQKEIETQRRCVWIGLEQSDASVKKNAEDDDSEGSHWNKQQQQRQQRKITTKAKQNKSCWSFLRFN